MEKLNRRIENYWDERSESFSQSRLLELDGVDGIAWTNILKKNLPVGKKLKILDIGTGAGFFAAILSKLGHEVIGVDMSKKMLAEARKNLRKLKLHAEFKNMNAQKLDFADETFDAVVTRNLTWTLPDVKTAYREWRRVLKVGGVLMNFDSDYGDKNFLDEKTCARGEVCYRMLNECDAIKNSVEISSRRRPSWDAGFLEGINFSVQTCARGEVCYRMLNECDAIKNSVEISSRRRPSWDAGFLEGINFSVRLDEDISHAVHRDKRCVYDSVPLFAIHATK